MLTDGAGALCSHGPAQLLPTTLPLPTPLTCLAAMRCSMRASEAGGVKAGATLCCSCTRLMSCWPTRPRVCSRERSEACRRAGHAASALVEERRQLGSSRWAGCRARQPRFAPQPTPQPLTSASAPHLQAVQRGGAVPVHHLIQAGVVVGCNGPRAVELPHEAWLGEAEGDLRTRMKEAKAAAGMSSRLRQGRTGRG